VCSDLGKARVKAMVEAFGGKVTSSVSGRTDVLIVGKDPGASKVGKAQSSSSCTLLSLQDVRRGLLLGDLATITNGKAPMVIQNFSAGFRGNGIGHAIKAPPPPPPPKAPAAPPATKPKPATKPSVAKPAPALTTATAGESPELAPSTLSAPTKAAAAEAKPAAKGKGLLAKAKEKKDAKKRKASADLWLAVEPIAPPKKARGPPKDRSRS